MSTQIEKGNEEELKDPDDYLIDFLIDDVYYYYFYRHMAVLRYSRRIKLKRSKFVAAGQL